MSLKDEVKNLSKVVGGWENLARGLHDFLMTWSNAQLLKYHHQTDIKHSKKVFDQVARGRTPKYKINCFEVEEIINSYPHKHEHENTIIEKNLDKICGRTIYGPTARDKANKTVQNNLAKHRKCYQRISAANATMASYRQFVFDPNSPTDPADYAADDDPRHY